MVTSTSAEESAGQQRSSLAVVVLGAVILGAGLWAIGRIAWWYGHDHVFVGGAHLRDPEAVRLPASVAVLVVVAGVVVLVRRRRVRGAIAFGGLVAVTVVAVVAAGLAVAAYPAIVHARVTATATATKDTGQWTTTVPLTTVSWISADADGRLTLGGTAMDHGCDDSYLDVTLDRATGELLEVRTLTLSMSPGTRPAAVALLEEHGLEVRQGDVPFTCSY